MPVLKQFLGSSAGLSPATVTRLTQQWQADHAAVMDRDFAEVDYVSGWADGIHLNVRLEEAKACVLVLVGVWADGSEELVALKDDYRESGESWADLLRVRPPGDAYPGPGSVTGLLVSGRPWPRSSPPPGIKGAGFTRRPRCSTLCRSRAKPGAHKAQHGNQDQFTCRQSAGARPR